MHTLLEVDLPRPLNEGIENPAVLLVGHGGVEAHVGDEADPLDFNLGFVGGGKLLELFRIKGRRPWR